MTLRRQILIHLLVAGVIAGSLYDIVTSQEHWLFSDYPMFSTHRGPPLKAIRLCSVSWDLEPHAANIEQPRSKRLIAEVASSQVAAAR